MGASMFRVLIPRAYSTLIHFLPNCVNPIFECALNLTFGPTLRQSCSIIEGVIAVDFVHMLLWSSPVDPKNLGRTSQISRMF
jgi:hypothetical protein